MVRKLVFVTQQVDSAHPTLGVTLPKIRALAARLDEVVVLADRAVAAELPANCRLRLYGAPTQLERGARYTAALALELRTRPLAVLVHMTPLLADLGGPLVRARRVPLLLWFTHWRVTRRLLLAERLATAVLTVDRRSFPLDSPKVVPIGHGIDMQAFRCVTRERSDRLRVLALGRTSPAKGLETVVRAAALADAELELRGPSLTEEERGEAARLESLGARVQPALPHTEIPALLSRKDVLVDNMREGALDKVVYEAAATCMPVLASNEGFADVLPPGLRFRRDDTEDLAEKLRALTVIDRNALGGELRARVEERHSVEHWADAVLEVAAP
jgi:glycosyltransferase involved in cell wall biosynthesis